MSKQGLQHIAGCSAKGINSIIDGKHTKISSIAENTHCKSIPAKHIITM